MKAATFLLFLPVLSAQNRPDLVIDGLSINSTLANASGQRQINVSFRVLNQGTAVAPATHTRVAFNQSKIDFPTPRIGPTISFAPYTGANFSNASGLVASGVQFVGVLNRGGYRLTGGNRSLAVRLQPAVTLVAGL